MVGPSISDDRRRTLSLRLKVGFVATVAASGGLTGLFAGGSAAVIAGGVGGGAVLGGVLVWYLGWLGREARLKARGSTREVSWNPGTDDEDETEADPERRELKRRR
jgi:hypothetical protein